MKVTKKEQADVNFVTIAHLPNGHIAIRLGLTEAQVEQKKKWMRKANKLVGNKSLDEWLTSPTGENEGLPPYWVYGTDIEVSDYLSTEPSEGGTMSVVDTLEGKINPDREENVRQFCGSPIDIATNRWINAKYRTELSKADLTYIDKEGKPLKEVVEYTKARTRNIKVIGGEKSKDRFRIKELPTFKKWSLENDYKYLEAFSEI